MAAGVTLSRRLPQLDVGRLPRTRASRPYADGSCNDSPFTQVFSYNGFGRLSYSLGGVAGSGCSRTSGHGSCRLQSNSGRTRGSAPSASRPPGIASCTDRSATMPRAPAARQRWLPCGCSSCGAAAPRTDIRARRRRSCGSIWLVVTFGLLQRRPVLELLLPRRADSSRRRAAAAWARWRRGSDAGSRAVRARARRGDRRPPWPSPSRSSRATSACAPCHHRPPAVAVGLLAVVDARRRRSGAVDDSVWAVSVGPALAAVAMLLGTVWASGRSWWTRPAQPVRLALTRRPRVNARHPARARRHVPGRPEGSWRAVRRQGLPPRPGRRRLRDVGRRPASTSWPPVGSSCRSVDSPGACPAPSLAEFKRLVARGPHRHG